MRTQPILYSILLLHFAFTYPAHAQNWVRAILKGLSMEEKSAARSLVGIGKLERAAGLTATTVTGAAIVVTGVGIVSVDAYLARGEAVYALEFDLNNDASSIYWADILSKPDVFPVLQVAGMGSFLIPDIAVNYAGGKIIWTFKVPKIPNHRDVSIMLFDDDSASDQIWKNVLSTRWSIDLKGCLLLQGIPFTATAQGSLQLVTKQITIDPPDQLCVYTITTPRFCWGGKWESSGDLKNGAGNKVGHIKFSQLVNK